MRAIELTEIASRLDARLTGEPDDAFTLAHCAGMWLEPRIGASCERFGRRVVYDPSADHGQQVARHAVRALLQAEGFEQIDDLPLEQLDALARKLVRERRAPSTGQALSA